MSFFENTRRPQGLGGKLMVSMMNVGHRALAKWGLQFLNVPADAQILDCGCGGGANFKTLLQMCPDGAAVGVDYSPVSVEKARKVNRKAIECGRCAVTQGSVAELPFAALRFDLATAFETVYFWPDLPQCFREVFRVLRPGGVFFICNECGGENEKDDRWTEIVEGMTVYREGQLWEALRQAGFSGVQTHKNEKGWLCAIAKK